MLMELRRGGISDTAVLSAMEKVPREVFVPDIFRDQAYVDRALPIGQGQTLSRPLVVATMTQALKAEARMSVLEVGTGSGYQCAVLSRLARRVYSVERHRPLLATAEARFRRLRFHNITAKVGDGYKGWREAAPFERIIVTAAPPDLPSDLVDQLAEGGVLVLPLGRLGRDQELLRVTRKEGRIEEESLGSVRFVPLVPKLPKGDDDPGSQMVKIR